MFSLLIKLNDKINSRVRVLSEKAKLKRSSKKEDGHGIFAAKLIVVFLSQYLISIFILAMYFAALNQGDGLSDAAVYSALKSVGAKDFLYVAIGVAAISLVDGVNKVALALLIMYAGVLIVLMQIVMWIPEDLEFSAQHSVIQRTISVSLLTIFVCMFWIPVNAVIVLVSRIANLGHASKNESAQLSHAPSDLAHDLRYSRSRARRSRAQR